MMEGLFVYIIVLIIALCLHGLLASKASDIASDKGYDKGTWFWMCFLLGFFAYMVVAAMPDRNLLNEQKRTNDLLQKLLDKKETGNSNENTNQFSFDDLPMM